MRDHHRNLWPVLVLASVTAGCTSRAALYEPGIDYRAHAPAQQVEVLLDHSPERPFVVTGTLIAHSPANDTSIEIMRERAQAEGLDGIYWIECVSRCSGTCTAKGFIYVLPGSGGANPTVAAEPRTESGGASARNEQPPQRSSLSQDDDSNKGAEIGVLSSAFRTWVAALVGAISGNSSESNGKASSVAAVLRDEP